jgi:FkbM family methyltransferase
MGKTTLALKSIVQDAFGVEIVRRHRLEKGLIHLAWPEELDFEFERRDLRRFWKHFQVDCIFDVGANIGQYAAMARSLGFTGPIISFEPIPHLADKVRGAATNDPDHYVEQLALDEVVRDTAFNVMAADQFSSLHNPTEVDAIYINEYNYVVETVPVTTARLDAIFDRYQAKLGFERPFLKMDTQGNDLAVARGAADRLQRFVGLQSELSFKPIYEGQANFTEVLAFYASQGFGLSALVPNNDGHFPDLVEMDCIMYNKSAKR